MPPTAGPEALGETAAVPQWSDGPDRGRREFVIDADKVFGHRVRVKAGYVDWWCRKHLGAPLDEVLFCKGYLSTALGAQLTSGQRVVVKLRPIAHRVHGCAAVHRFVFERGFPSPEPLVDPEPIGEGLLASAEALVSGGEDHPASGRSPAPFAVGLAQLVGTAPAPTEVPSLEPQLPWTTPDFGTSELWPAPVHVDVDLNAADGWDWIDDAGWLARSRLAASRSPHVVGHGDWLPQNLRWTGDELFAVWDWDSLIAAPETSIAGVAAVTYVYGFAGVAAEATVEESEGFLDAYQAARGRFTEDELGDAWAAALWNRSFCAKARAVVTGDPALFTAKEAAELRRRVE